MMSERTASALSVSSVKRIHGRAVLTLSSGEILPMPRAMLKERPYKSGMPFDRAAFDLFIREQSYAFGLEKAISLLAARARTEKEIVDALRKNAYPEDTIARIMRRLQEAGYIDDADFAAQWTAARTSKGLGIRRIRMELRLKGVDQDQIDQILTNTDEEQWLEGAIKVAHKAARGKDLSSATDRQKILAALARRGYDFSLAKKALQYIMDNH